MKPEPITEIASDPKFDPPAACSQACAVLPEFLRYGLGARGALSGRC